MADGVSKLSRHGTSRSPPSKAPAVPPAPYLRKHKNSYQQRWENTFGKEHIARWHPQSVVELVRKEGKTMLLLVSIGVCASILDYAVELCVIGLGQLRVTVLSLDILPTSEFVKFAAWSGCTTVIALLGILWTRLIDPIAAGSGIPEMKTIISCDQRKEAGHFLGRRTLISKAGGLALALGSGLSLGKEGPFVHTASIIAHSLMSDVGFFHRILNNDILRRHMYNAACAVGVASTFRAPVGGVLFAIEVTSTVFMVTNYWRAFVAAISGSIARLLVRMIHETEVTAFHPMFPTSFAAKSFSYPEFAAFALLGVLMGIAGAAYVTLSGRFKHHWKIWTAKYPLMWSIVLLLLTSCVLYLPGPFSRLSIATTLSDLCSPNELTGAWARDVSSMSVFVLLPLAAVVRLIATTFSTSLPLPAGDFIPTFAAGTALGRLYGEILHLCFPDAGIVPGGYALVGGAAFVGSATHTVSVAVIAVEFTAQFVYITPLIMSVLLASGIGSALSVSLYESVIISKGLTYLPLLRANQLEGFKARDVMAIEFPLIPMETSVRHVRFLLERHATVQSFPVVDTVESMIFYGCVSREGLRHLSETTMEEVSSLDPIRENDDRSLSQPRRKSSLKGDELRPQTGTIPSPSSTSPRKSANQKPLQPTALQPLRAINLRHFPSVAIDSAVLQVDSDAPVQTVHLLFEMIKTSCIWVTRRGRLIGLIRRKHLHAKVMSLRRDMVPISV